MTDIQYTDFEQPKNEVTTFLTPFMVAGLICCALMYAMYCLNINLPEIVITGCFLVALPFFKEEDFLALGACSCIIGGIKGFTIVWGCAFLVYFFKYRGKLHFNNIFWIVFGFVLIEIFDALMFNDYFTTISYLQWSGKLFYFAFCVGLVANVGPDKLLQIMKNYVVIYCCAATILLQRFITEAGSLQAILMGARRLGDMRNFYGFDITAEVSNGLSFNPNSLGGLSILCFGICLLFIYLHYGRRWLWMGIAGFATMVVLMTQSRASMLAWILTAFIYFFDFRSLRKSFTIAVIGTVLVGGLGFMLYGYSDSFAIMFDNMVARFTMEGDITAGRLNLWEWWNDYYFEHPSMWLTGFGSKYAEERYGYLGIFNCIHNGIQEGYVYWGVIGLFLMFALNWFIYKIAKKAAGGYITKLNFLLMLPLYLYWCSGQYMTGGFDKQIIAACVMAYPFWKHQDGSSEDGVRNAE